MPRQTRLTAYSNRHFDTEIFACEEAPATAGVVSTKLIYLEELKLFDFSRQNKD